MLKREPYIDIVLVLNLIIKLMIIIKLEKKKKINETEFDSNEKFDI